MRKSVHKMLLSDGIKLETQAFWLYSSSLHSSRSSSAYQLKFQLLNLVYKRIPSNFIFCHSLPNTWHAFSNSMPICACFLYSNPAFHSENSHPSRITQNLTKSLMLSLKGKNSCISCSNNTSYLIHLVFLHIFPSSPTWLPALQRIFILNIFSILYFYVWYKADTQ